MAKYLTIQNNVDTSIVAGDLLGQIGFASSVDSDGGDSIAITAAILAKAEGTFDASNNPAAIVFSTGPSSTPTERIKITNEGHLVPITDISYDLGVSGSLHFRDVCLSGIIFNDGTYQTTAFTGGGGGGTPGGSDTQVQFNDGGSTFGGNAGFTYDKTAQKMYSRSYYTNITDSGNITSSVTLDLDQSNFHQVTLSGNPITIAVANGDVGQRFIIRLKQDNTGSRTVNWFSTISWPGGGPPALSTATGVADLLGFVVTAANEYDGFLMVSGIY